MTQVFSYDENQAAAADAGGGEYITESCVVRGFVEQAKWTEANSGAKGLELSFESEHGQKANYLTIYYQKKDGSKNEVGVNQIQSLMGVTGVQSLSQQGGQNGMIAPELTRKPVQIALERENYTKSNGGEGFRFQIKCFMSARSGKTIAEHLEGKSADSAAYWEQRFAENPGGKQAKQQQSQPYNSANEYANSNIPPSSNDFDDEIPF
ncbi:hypothetical protein C7446_2527 [Kushneria sinocarnis]|uniref:Uncharacterized protein n=1 Tax=Kushneria sinocarnis TaxID=595502 RepID=A0A420WUI7_9GAMM|nr:hypothetical protein [Kushneria sinocarnis]RKQ97108.1 hypothetical protein C7446_2527 [Kushneria sinocarnis]